MYQLQNIEEKSHNCARELSDKLAEKTAIEFLEEWIRILLHGQEQDIRLVKNK